LYTFVTGLTYGEICNNDGCRVLGSFLTRHAIGDPLSTLDISSAGLMHPRTETDGSGVSVSVDSTATVSVRGTVGEEGRLGEDGPAGEAGTLADKASMFMSGSNVVVQPENPSTRRFDSSNS